jgi:DNA repair exonuclease SbcCD ATPase subunit
LIKRLKLTNFGGHESLDIDLNGRCVGILGANFTGKSTVLKALEFAWTGGLDEKAESFVRSAADGSVANAEVEMDFEKSGITGKIYRRVGKSPKRWLELSTMVDATGKPERIAKAAEIDKQLAAIFCADKQAIANAIFLPQGYLDKLLFGDQPEREKLFMRLLLIGHFGTVENAVDTQITSVSAMLQDCGTVMDEVRTQLRDSQEKQSTLSANLAGLLDPSETITRYRTYLNAVKAQEAALNGVSLAEAARASVHDKLKAASVAVEKEFFADLDGGDPKSVLAVTEAKLAEADASAAKLLAECSELSAFITRADTLSAAWADHERLKAAGLVFDTERATLQTALDALPKDITKQMEQLRSIATYEQTQAAATAQIAKLETASETARQEVARNINDTARMTQCDQELFPLEKEAAALSGRATLAERLRVQQAQAGCVGDKCPMCAQDIPAELVFSKDDEQRLFGIKGQIAALKQTRTEAMTACTTRNNAVTSAETALREAQAQLTLSQKHAPAPYTGTHSLAELEIAEKNRQELTIKLGVANAQWTANNAEIDRINALHPVGSWAWLVTEAKPEIVAQKKARLAAATKLREEWVTYVNYWRPEVAKLQTALREAGEASGRYEAAKEAYAEAGAIRVRAGVVIVEAGRANAEADAIAMELPILEGTQTQRQQLQGELRQLDSAITTLHKRLKELKDLQDKQEDVRALVEDLRRLKGTFTRQGLPRMYLSERFNQLTGLTQRNLGMLNANFVVTPSVDEVLSFDFTDQERPWIGKLSQSKLSGAQRVLLTISFLLAVQQLILPQVGLLVLDEPTCHLDRFAIESLRDLFAGMQPQMRSSDMQVIVVDHCLELVSGFDKNVRLTRVLGEGNKNG